MGKKSFNTLTSEIRQKANEIAVNALNQDVGLLAVAIGNKFIILLSFLQSYSTTIVVVFSAAPSIKLAVVQFRDHVENAKNHSYLSTYWRELGKKFFFLFSIFRINLPIQI